MPLGKYLEKEWIKLIPIEKDEAQILNKVYGVNFGSYGISHTYTRYKKYFLCESKKNLDALKKVRNGMNVLNTKQKPIH